MKNPKLARILSDQRVIEYCADQPMLACALTNNSARLADVL